MKNHSSNQLKNEHYQEEIKDIKRILISDTYKKVKLENLEEIMNTIFPEEVPKEFSEQMKKEIRVIKYSDHAYYFKGKDNQNGLEPNSFECNLENNYFFCS